MEGSRQQHWWYEPTSQQVLTAIICENCPGHHVLGKGSLCIQQLKGSNEELSGKQQRYRVEDNITVLAFNHVRSLASWQLKTRRQCVYYNVIGAVVHCGLVHCATHGTLSKRLVDLGGLSWALSEGAVVQVPSSLMRNPDSASKSIESKSSFIGLDAVLGIVDNFWYELGVGIA